MSTFPLGIQALGALTLDTAQKIQDAISQMGLGQTGNVYYVDPVHGNNNSGTGSLQQPLASLAAGYAKMVSGNNDVLVLIGNGATSASARISSTFTWAKNACHLVGVSSGVNISNRSRIAPTTGATAFPNFFVVSGSGCIFQNIQWFQGFTTGVAASICVKVTGGRNLFVGCHIAGMGDTDGASAQDADSRNLWIATTGENQFVNCTIGIDTIARTAANASVEFSGGAPRNVFYNCLFPLLATSATVLIGKVAATAGSDRFQLFDRCTFINAIKSTGTAITGAFTLAASMGGMLVFRDLTTVGVTSLGSDATSKAQMYAFGPANSTSTSIAANPA